jgi:peptide/nickel transport system permease protein
MSDDMAPQDEGCGNIEPRFEFMTAYVLQRLIQSVFVLLAVSVVVFFAVYGIGDPIELLVPPQASQAERLALIRRLGLDLPVWQQYLTFMGNALKGDLGRSFVHGVSAIELILARAPATFELVLLAMTLAVAGGVPLGLAAGLDPESRRARIIMAGTVLGYSLPNFWKGMMLILLFSVVLGWLPTAGRGETVTILGLRTSLFTLDGLQHLILPALNLAIPNLALIIRLVAAGTGEAMTQDYVKYARAKGVRRRRIVGRHVLRNILIPVVTVVGIEFGSLVAFSTITETVFAWPGMGKLLIDSVYQLDRPVVVAYVLLATLLFVTVNFLVDILYAALDPRVTLTGEQA